MTERRIIRVVGRVQGVYFRQSAKQEAIRLNLAGFARNEPDGSVHIDAEGDPAALDEFVAWCHHGPPSATVERVDAEGGAVVGHRGFRSA